MNNDEERKYIEEYFRIDDDVHMIDRYNRRWCKCKHCGQLKPTDDMVIYGGRGAEMNLGECRNCLISLGII